MSDTAQSPREVKVPQKHITGGQLVAKALKAEGIDVI